MLSIPEKPNPRLRFQGEKFFVEVRKVESQIVEIHNVDFKIYVDITNFPILP
jgi:hypothetical protein